MKLDYPFSNHMVLQHGKTINITGLSNSDNLIIKFLKKEYNCIVENGKWNLELFLEDIGGPYSMTFIEDGNEIVLDDLYVGDVFLAAGQSNMEYKVKQLQAKDDIKVTGKVICYLNVPQNYYEDDNEVYPGIKETGWNRISTSNIQELSAIAYYFVYYLNSDIPVGIISNNKGGTSASCWISEQSLNGDSDLKKIYYDSYYNDIKDISMAKQKESYLNYVKRFDHYQIDYQNYALNHPNLKPEDIKDIIGHTPWPPAKSYLDFLRPCGLYQTMFLKTVNYPVCAILWYQGEEDAIHASSYEKLLKLVIKNWRDTYNEDLPFYIVQLPEYNAPIKNSFSKIRLAQQKVVVETDNTYLIVALKTGNPRNIHPENKKDVGYRLAMSVKKYHYKENVVLFPELINSIVHDKYIELIFDQQLNEGTIMIDTCVGDNHQKSEAIIKANKVVIKNNNIDKVLYALDDVPNNFIENIYGLPSKPFELILNK